MADFNRTFLMGRLTKDPELRYTTSGSPVVNIRLAVNRVFRNQSGEQKEEVCFVPVVIWGKQAEAVGEYVKKGDPIFVEGRLQSRSWETEDGQKRSALEVVALRVQFLARASRSAGADAPAEAPADSGSDFNEEDIPF